MARNEQPWMIFKEPGTLRLSSETCAATRKRCASSTLQRL
jgi:hypothetical protein